MVFSLDDRQFVVCLFSVLSSKMNIDKIPGEPGV